jgi:hypothetical protein
MSKKVIVVPSFSTKPAIKGKGKMSKSEAEKRIIKKHESEKLKQANSNNQQEVKKQVFIEKKKSNKPVIKNPVIPETKPDVIPETKPDVIKQQEPRNVNNRREARNNVHDKKELFEKRQPKINKQNRVTPVNNITQAEQPKQQMRRNSNVNNNIVKPKRNELRSNTTIKPGGTNKKLTAREKAVERIKEKRQGVVQNRDNSINYNTNIARIFDSKNSDSVFVVAGGPSLSGFDFSLLDGKDVIAVNKAVDHIKKPSYFVTVDYTYLSKSDHSIKTYSDRGIKTVFIASTSLSKKNDTYVDTKHNITYSRLNEFNHIVESNCSVNAESGFSSNFTNFANGTNSGFCAVQLAISLGYKNIYLLGFDYNTDGERTHFHNSYNTRSNIFERIAKYKENIITAIKLNNGRANIISCSATSALNEYLPYMDFNEIEIENNEEHFTNDLSSLLIVGYYTVNTPYEQEAQRLIQSCKNLGLNYDIQGVKNLGSWQSNTRFKANFMLNMLHAHPGKRLLYVDCDAVIHKTPDLFINYNADISVRYQDFNYRKNECLSGTIYMENNLKTKRLCEIWANTNRTEGPNAISLEQVNLGMAIDKMVSSEDLIFKNLPPEYTFIFDSMRKIYPDAKPVIEHFQASRKYRHKV